MKKIETINKIFYWYVWLKQIIILVPLITKTTSSMTFNNTCHKSVSEKIYSLTKTIWNVLSVWICISIILAFLSFIISLPEVNISNKSPVADPETLISKPLTALEGTGSSHASVIPYVINKRPAGRRHSFNVCHKKKSFRFSFN